jgi:tight adherence protein B
MSFGPELTQYAILFMIAASVGGIAIAILWPWLTGDADMKNRVKSVAEGSRGPAKQGLRSRFLTEDPKESRRKQIQESLNQVGERERQRKKRLTLRLMISQAGYSFSARAFWFFSVIVGVALGFGAFTAGAPWYVAAGAGVVGFLGLPRWFLAQARKRRQNAFLADFADAIDIIVRGLKAGLPVNDAMKVIASETPPPVGPEFTEVVEGQRIGITPDQGVERMFERMPLSEVNFLAIVMAIQSKTGGNLAEALNNLSKVLRDRKKMKAKIKAVSQEAKSSAMIIGALPFCIMGVMVVFNPNYLEPMWNTNAGNIMLACSGLWMGTGVLVMRKMINFEI